MRWKDQIDPHGITSSFLKVEGVGLKLKTSIIDFHLSQIMKWEQLLSLKKYGDEHIRLRSEQNETHT